MKRLLSSRLIKALVFALCLGPLFALGWRALTDRLGANPIELVTHSTGDWTIRYGRGDRGTGGECVGKG